jgi:carbohydrate kinase (thermoresistant glucokinase family)
MQSCGKKFSLIKLVELRQMHTSIVVMGVSGCGKTTVGQQLATRLEYPFFDADDFHSVTNKEKMAAGTPLTDADRETWLETLANLLELNAPCVLACSALKERYRVQLARGTQLTWVYLKGSQELIAARLATREHFFNPVLLESQFAILEEPTNAIVILIESSLETIVETVLGVLSTSVLQPALPVE